MKFEGSIGSRLRLTAEEVKGVARDCGFELAGIAAALPHSDYSRFESWRKSGRAAEMEYMTGRRGDLRSDPRALLPDAQTILCVGKLYNSPHPRTDFSPDKGWLSRYAWGDDYHDIMRDGLRKVITRLEELNGAPIAHRICVDTTPLLERSYARSAGLGWIGKNTCLINQQQGSWFFLGELLLAVELTVDAPPPDRCGTCTRCIDACPTAAIVPTPDGGWTLDSGRCISYLTIEKRGALHQAEKAMLGNHVFGCDICQDVCPWNRSAAVTEDRRFWPREIDRRLEKLVQIGPEQFRTVFAKSPVKRTKFEGFVRNVLAALGSLVLAVSLHASPDPLANPGYQYFYNLEYDNALSYFQSQTKSDPSNPSWYNAVAQSILYRQMYREGELTTSLVDSSNSFLTRPKLHFSRGDRDQFEHAVNHVVSLASSAKDSATFYAVGVGYGLQATYLFDQKDYIGALKASTAANRAEEQALELDPKFTDARLIPAVYTYVVGSLPFYLRVLSFMGGFHGSVEEGIRELENVRSRGFLNRYDAQILLAAIYRREHQPDKAVPLLQNAAERFPRNPLLRTELANVRAEAAAQSARAQR